MAKTKKNSQGVKVTSYDEQAAAIPGADAAGVLYGQAAASSSASQDIKNTPQSGTAGFSDHRGSAPGTQYGQAAGAAQGDAQSVIITHQSAAAGSTGPCGAAPDTQYGQTAGADQGDAQSVIITPQSAAAGSSDPRDASGTQCGQAAETTDQSAKADADPEVKFVTEVEVKNIFMECKAHDRHYNVTAIEVRKKLGNRGSYHTIQKFLTQAENEWRENNKPKIGNDALKDQATKDLLNLLTERIAEFTINEYETRLQEKDKDLAALYHEKQETAQELAMLLEDRRSQCQDLAARNDALLQKQEKLTKENEDLLTAKINLTKKFEEAQEKLKDCLNVQTLLDLLSHGKHSIEELIKLSKQLNLTKEEKAEQEK